jgi:hypothetical protein
VPRLPRLSIGQLMALIAVLAVDCVYLRSVLRTRNPEGLLTLTQSLTLGMVVALRGRGRLRRFSIGVVVAAVATLAGLIVTALLLPNGERLFIAYMNWALSHAPALLVRSVGTAVFPYVFMELALSGPILCVALCGGVLWLRLGGRRRLNPAMNPT